MSTRLNLALVVHETAQELRANRRLARDKYGQLYVSVAISEMTPDPKDSNRVMIPLLSTLSPNGDVMEDTWRGRGRSLMVDNSGIVIGTVPAKTIRKIN